MAAFDFAGLGFPAYVPVQGSVGSIYANPSGKTTFIKGLVLYNANTSAEAVTVYMVPNSAGSLGTAGATNQIAALSIAAGDTVFFPLNVDGQPILLTGHNDSIQAGTTTASKVNVVPVGDTYTP